MDETLKEWIKKAEMDYRASLTLSNDTEIEFYDPVCFHAQQSAEKYLKAFLFFSNSPFEKVHDLILLLNQCIGIDPTFEFIRASLEFLNDYGVTIRYPGDFATKEETIESLKHVAIVRKFVRGKLKL